MPQIPLNNWGNAVAGLAPDPQFATREPSAFVTDSGLAGAKALTQSSGIVADEAARVAAFNAHLAKQAEDEKQRLLQFSESIQAKHDELQLQEQSQNKVRDLALNDSLNPDQKRQEYTKFFDAASGQYTSKYANPAVSSNFQIATEAIKAKHAEALDTSIYQATLAQNQANILGSLDVLSRMASNDPVKATQQMAGIVRNSGRAAGWDPAQIEKIVEKQRQDYFATYVTGQLYSDPAGTLKALTAGKYQELDPDKRLILTKEAAAEIDRRQARADRAYDAQMRIAERQVNNLARIYDAGAVPPPAMLTQVASMVKGTELEPEFKAMAATVEDRAKFATMPLDQQLAEIGNLHKTATDPTQGATLAQAQEINWKAKQYDNTVKDINADALTAAKDRGLVTLQPIDPSSPETIGKSIGARLQQAEMASIWAGVPVSPLTKQETLGLAEIIKHQMSEAQQVYLQGLASAINDPPKLNALLASIAPNHGALASAGRLLASDDPTAKQAGQLILRGESYLNVPWGEKPKVEMPSETGAAGFQSMFDESTNGVYNNHAQARDLDYRNTLRIYAALAAQDGVYAGKIDKVDSDRFQKALDLATGGIEDYKGKSIQLPRGVSREELDRTVTLNLDMLHDHKALAGDFTKSQLHNLQLENTAQNGVYGYLVKQGSGYLLDKHYRPVFIDPSQDGWTPNARDVRSDGSQKGTGWLGVLKRPDGKVSSEISVGVKIDGKEVDIPTLVPTLTQDEIHTLLTMDLKDPNAIPQPIIDKAIAHARPLISKGLSPFKN
ncbi:MAG: hypothetical protein HYX63_01600 [Gammaproteobacteria bacterium]|nr:hypothetical protein [Gammaproteobacteria bacterium]